MIVYDAHSFLYIIAHIHVWCICYDKSVYLKVNPTSYNDVFKKLSNWTMYMHTNFLIKSKWLGRWRWHFGVALESHWEILFLTLVCLSVLSPNSDGVFSGMDHGSTWARVEPWWDRKHDCGYDHHGCADILSFRWCIWRSITSCPTRYTTCPWRFPWSNTRPTIGAVGLSTEATAGFSDGAYVPKATLGRIPAHRSSDRTELHGHS